MLALACFRQGGTRASRISQAWGGIKQAAGSGGGEGVRKLSSPSLADRSITEIAFECGYITAEQVLKQADYLGKTEYAKYLRRLIEDMPESACGGS